MTFSEICTEIIDFRFREGLRTNVKRWVNHREALIWNAAEWPFKMAPVTDLTITTGDSTPTLPADYDRPSVIFDDDGLELLWMAPNDFDRQFRASTLDNTRAKPVAYKWSDRVLTLGDIPDRDYTFSHSYMRMLSHFNNVGVSTVGPMSADSDYPLYDSQWHYLLVLGGMATGLKVENDPTYPGIEEEFNVMLQSMRESYLPSTIAGANLQYGRDELGMVE